MEQLKRKALGLGATDLQRSDRKNSKYYVVYQGKKIHFGHKSYEDYTTHKDEARRASYLKRARGIKDKQGNLTHEIKSKSNFWAINLLW